MLFVIDFDGTLAVEDSVDGLLARFARPAWRDVEEEWLAGRLTAIECMQRQVRMIRASAAQLDEYFRAIRLDADFLAFHRHVSRFAEVAVVSDGLDHAVRVALATAGFPDLPVFANRLHIDAEGCDLSFPHRDAACTAGNGVCKCAISRRLATQCGGPVVLVGDGKSDHCLAAQADIVFATKSLRRHCQDNGIAFHPFTTFADVLATVSLWPVDAAAHSIEA